jgi:hypothetical protein
VSDLSSPVLPAWVRKRDGRLVPFEPDRICQALFAATEAVGRPDAFLARELTDSVLHFLAAESAGAAPGTAQVAELAAKVVRELGHPALARAYEERRRRKVGRPAEPAGVPFRFAPSDPPAAVVAGCLREYSLHAVFSRDLVAAQADGLLTLAGLGAPLGLAGCVLGPPAGAEGGLFEALTAAGAVAGGFVAVDGPDHALARLPGGDPDAYVRELQRALLATGLRAVVNLGCEAAPPWADGGAGGPLFGGPRSATTSGKPQATAEALLACILGEEGLRRQAWALWHLGERDFAGGRSPALLQAARAATAGPGVAFVFDRPRRPVGLGPGLDRRHPAALLAVGLHLPRLAEVVAAGQDAELFLRKLASLARLALSAGAQKRAFLRRHSRAADGTVTAVGRGFLPDRARLVVVPVGLDVAVRSLTGQGLCDGKPGLECGRQIVRQMAAVLEREGPAAGLEACVDGTGGGMEEWERAGAVPTAAAWPEAHQVAGLTAWALAAPARDQLRAAGALHAIAGRGTAAAVLPDPGVPAEDVVDLLQFAWRQTDVVGLRFLRAGLREQRTLPGLQ